MIILQREDGNEGGFFLEQDGEELAEMTYRLNDNRMVIQHTEVDEALRGQNVGFQLVEHAVTYARTSGLKIVPLCKFAKKVIERHQEFHDVL